MAAHGLYVQKTASGAIYGVQIEDNTHHALFMAYSAVDCLLEGRFDEARWQAFREVFRTHVVED